MKTVEHLTEEQLQGYAAESLEERERQQIGTHLLQCSVCRAQLRQPEPEKLWMALMTENELTGNTNAAALDADSIAFDFSLVSKFFRALFQPTTLVPLTAVLTLILTVSLLGWRTTDNQTAPAVIAKDEHKTTTITEPDNLKPSQLTEEQKPSVVFTVRNGVVSNKTEKRLLNAPPRAQRKSVSPLKDEHDGVAEPRELAQLLKQTPEAVLALRSGGTVVLRNNSPQPSTAKTFALLSPVGVKVLETQPEFRWAAVPGAKSYRVSIINSSYDEVASATVDEPRFALNKSLKRGEAYLWRVTAQVDSDEIISPRPPQPPALFRIAEDETVARVTAFHKQTTAKLALAAFYAKEGMLTEATAILREILRDNPRHRAARRLLRRVELWQAENQPMLQCDPPTTTKGDQ